MAAVLGDAALAQDDDERCVTHGTEPVRDEHAGEARAVPPKCGALAIARLPVYPGGWSAFQLIMVELPYDEQGKV